MARTEPHAGAGRVTGVVPDVRHPAAVRIAVEGRLTWTVSRHDADALGVASGMVVDPPLRERLLAAADAEGAWRALLRHLERRPFARADLGRRLRRRSHPAAAVELALARADEAGLVDDLAFARSYAQTRSARGRGPSRLHRDLAAQGVAREVIEQVLRELWPDGEGPVELARTLARKRAGQLAGVAPEERRRRVLAYLARRGFAGATARRVVHEEMAG